MWISEPSFCGITAYGSTRGASFLDSVRLFFRLIFWSLTTSVSRLMNIHAPIIPKRFSLVTSLVGSKSSRQPADQDCLENGCYRVDCVAWRVKKYFDVIISRTNINSTTRWNPAKHEISHPPWQSPATTQFWRKRSIPGLKPPSKPQMKVIWGSVPLFCSYVLTFENSNNWVYIRVVLIWKL